MLGQVQSKGAIEALKRALANKDLNCMIRHEAAEALGNIIPENDEEVTWVDRVDFFSDRKFRI